MDDAEITVHGIAAGRGDMDAAATFIKATQAQVWRFIAHLTDPDSADDLTQETYLRALRGLRTYRGDCDARLWLLSIARHTVTDHIRRKYRQPVLAVPAELTMFDRYDAEPRPDHAERLALHELIRRLEPDRRAAFVLTQILGLSYAETAVCCGVAIGTIRSRVARARGELAQRLTAADSALRA